MSIYYPAGKNSDQPLVDSKDYILNTVRQYNTQELLSVVRPPIAPEYYSLNYAQVYSKGYGYPDSTTLSIDSPSLNDGVQATCYPSFGLSIFSLNISGPNHQPGDIYVIYPSNNDSDIDNSATVKVVLVDNGYVKTYEVIESGSNFNNSSDIVCYKNSKSTADEDGDFGVDDMELSDNISLINNKFSISKVIITNEGSGYSRYDASRKTIEYKITANSNNIGSNFYGTLKSKNYFVLENTGTRKTKARNRNRNRNTFTNKYGETVINASSVLTEETLYDKIFYVPTKTEISSSSQQYLTYSFDKEKNEWISLETISDPSSEDKCSTFNNGFVYATLSFAMPDFDDIENPKCQIFDRAEVNKDILKRSIKNSMDKVIQPRKILEILRAAVPNAQNSADFFDAKVIKGIGLTVANDVKKNLAALSEVGLKLDHKSFGFCSLKEMDDFVKNLVAAELNSARTAFSNSMLDLVRKTLRPGESIFGFSYPLNNYNLEIVRGEIERRLYRFGGSWQKIINVVSGEVGSFLGYSNGYGNLLLDPFDNPSKPIKVKPKAKTGLLKALADLVKPGTVKVKCVNGKAVLKGAGKALKVLAVYAALQELAQAQDGYDVRDTVLEFASPLPVDWFRGGNLPVINLNNIPQQDRDILENQIIDIITRYTLYPNPEAMRAELNLILQNFVPKTLDDFGQPITEEQLNEILQNIIDDADSIRDQLGDDTALEDLNINIEELKRQLDFYDAANKNMEQAFMDAFGSSDICDCPGTLEEKAQDFNEKAQKILDDYLQHNENLRQKGPMTEDEWKKEEQKLLGPTPFSSLQNGLPTISMMRMPLNDKDEPILPSPKNPSNQKRFNGLDMYQIR